MADVERNMETIKELAELEVQILETTDDIESKKSDLKELKRMRKATVEQLISAGMGMKKLEEFGDQEPVTISGLIMKLSKADIHPKHPLITAALGRAHVESVHSLPKQVVEELVERAEMSEEDALSKVLELRASFEECDKKADTLLDGDEPEDLTKEGLFELLDLLRETSFDIKEKQKTEAPEPDAAEEDPEEDDDTPSWLTTVPASDVNFKGHLKTATSEQVIRALQTIYGKDGQKGRTKALLAKAKKEGWISDTPCPGCGFEMILLEENVWQCASGCGSLKEPESLKEALDNVHKEESDGKD